MHRGPLRIIINTDRTTPLRPLYIYIVSRYTPRGVSAGLLMNSLVRDIRTPLLLSSLDSLVTGYFPTCMHRETVILGTTDRSIYNNRGEEKSKINQNNNVVMILMKAYGHVYVTF